MKSYRIILIVLLACILLAGVMNYLSFLKVQNDSLMGNIEQIRKQIRLLETNLAQVTSVKEENARLKGQVESLKTQLAMVVKQPAKAQVSLPPVTSQARTAASVKPTVRTPDTASGNKGFLLKK